MTGRDEQAEGAEQAEAEEDKAAESGSRDEPTKDQRIAFVVEDEELA